MLEGVATSKKYSALYLPQSAVFHHASHSLRRQRLKRFAIGILTGLSLLSFCFNRLQRTESISLLPCQDLPGAHETLVVMKTGVTQLEDKLPIHLETTIKCYSDYVIFSDHEEIYQGKYEIRDVLANVDTILQQDHEDFELYRHVKAVGREGLDPADLTGTSSSRTTTPDQKHTISGWVLDKWKFLPMLNETFYLHPNHKWYVFVETDTYLFWTTTLKYLSILDYTKPHFVGCQGTDNNIFAQGGSGYVVSNPALRLFVDYLESNHTELDKFTESKWAGDYILGVVFQQAGVPLTPVWPIYQSHHFGFLDFGIIHNEKRFWCYPAGSFHHMTPDAVRELWTFEQEWIQSGNEETESNAIIRYSDVFSDFILPRMRFPQYDWDNQCDIVKENIETVEDCENECVMDHACMQYMFDTNLPECKTLNSARLGEASLGSGLYSNWMFDRIEKWRDSQPPCDGESFIYVDDEGESRDTAF